jgi:hypothetical protein
MKPKAIVLHVSASDFGDAATITDWHRERGWKTVGYHRVILNGFRRRGTYNPEVDGLVENGRSENVVGAHCLGMNGIALGICCIGNPGWTPKGPAYLTSGNTLLGRVVNRDYMTRKQHTALVEELARLCRTYDIDPMGTLVHNGKKVHTISQHSDHDSRKPLCASINLTILRKQVAARLKAHV